MLLDPGPIPDLSGIDYNPTFDYVSFSDFTAAQLGPLVDIEASMDATVDPIDAIDDALSGDTIISDLTDLDQINGDNAATVNLAGIPVLDAYKTEGDTAILAAYGTIPGEAFTPVPTQLLTATGSPQPGNASITGFTITNNTNPSAYAFTVGDSYTITVNLSTATGNAADYFKASVSLTRTLDGIAAASITMPQADDTGTSSYTATWLAADPGNWMITANVTTTLGQTVTSINPLSVWVYTAGNTPTGPNSVTVALGNPTTGDYNNFFSGDQWTLTVHGLPNSAIVVNAVLNGTGLAPATIGTTDNNGDWSGGGIFTDAGAGNWIEYYTVGTQKWAGVLVFSVSPKQETQPIVPTE